MTSISSAGLRMGQSLDKKIRYCTALKLSFQTLEKNQHSNWALTLHVSILQDRRLMMMHLNGHGVRLKDSSNTYINHIPDLNTQLRNGRVHVKKTMYWIVEAIKNSQITWKFNGAQDNQNKISSKVNAINIGNNFNAKVLCVTLRKRKETSQWHSTHELLQE